MVVHVYSCLFTGIILVQIHTGILNWNRTGIFMNICKFIHVPGILEKQSTIHFPILPYLSLPDPTIFVICILFGQFEKDYDRVHAY